jgi:hypothetical protein
VPGRKRRTFANGDKHRCPAFFGRVAFVLQSVRATLRGAQTGMPP